MTAIHAIEVISSPEAEAIELMGRIGWLSRTPQDFSKNVLRRCRLLAFEGGEPIYDVGDPPGGLYGLVSGGVAVMIASRNQGPYLAQVMGPGVWYGLASALNRQSRLIGLTATRRSQILHLPMSEFDKMVADDPGVWRFFTVLALVNSEFAMRAVDDLLIRDPARRCIASLLRLAGHRHSFGNTLILQDVDVTQEELAQISNLSRNTIGTILRSMEKRRLLKLTYRSIRILDAAALLAMVEWATE